MSDELEQKLTNAKTRLSKHLSVNNKDLEKIPSAIFEITSLQVLDISNNPKITEISDEKLCDLVKLQELYLSHTGIRSLPANFCNTTISILHMEGLNLKEIPPVIFACTTLQNLSFNENEISEIPKEIGNLKNMEVLLLDSNVITTIPAEIGNLTLLSMLSLQNNPINDLPAELSFCSNLSEIVLSNEHLKEDIRENYESTATLLSYLETKTTSSMELPQIEERKSVKVISDQNINLSHIREIEDAFTSILEQIEELKNNETKQIEKITQLEAQLKDNEMKQNDRIEQLEAQLKAGSAPPPIITSSSSY